MTILIDIIMLALFVEAIVSAVKPLWNDGGKGLTVTEIVSIVIGIVLAVAMRIDLFSYLADVHWDSPPWVNYLFYAMSGVALGRGPSFVYDLWESFRKWSEADIVEHTLTTTQETAVDIDIDNWSVAQLRRFCEANGIPCGDCITKDDYITAIVHGTDKPPNAKSGD